MEFEDVVKEAKHILVTTGKHHMQVILEEPDGSVGLVMFDFDRDLRDGAVEQLRNVVFSKGIERYWFVTEAWMTTPELGKDIPVMPRLSADRVEVLVVSEFRKDMKTKGRFYPFHREAGNISKNGMKGAGEKIVFDDDKKMNHSQMVHHKSVWNVYVETEGVNEGFDKFDKMYREAFFKKASKEIAAKYWEDFKAAKTDKDMANLIKNMTDGMKQKILEQRRKVLEDPDKEEDGYDG